MRTTNIYCNIRCLCLCVAPPFIRSARVERGNSLVEQLFVFIKFNEESLLIKIIFSWFARVFFVRCCGCCSCYYCWWWCLCIWLRFQPDIFGYIEDIVSIVTLANVPPNLMAMTHQNMFLHCTVSPEHSNIARHIFITKNSLFIEWQSFMNCCNLFQSNTYFLCHFLVELGLDASIESELDFPSLRKVSISLLFCNCYSLRDFSAHFIGSFRTFSLLAH